MRTLPLYGTLVTVTVLAACGPEGEPPKLNDPRPVDAVYQVNIVLEETGCLGGTPLKGPAYLMDVMLRPDGLLNITPGTIWIPGPALIEGIRSDNGNIDQTVTYPLPFSTEDPPKMRSLKVEGIVTREEVDLVFTEEDSCGTAKTHAFGLARPLADPERLDGIHLFTVKDYGYLCGDAERGTPSQWTIEADVMDTHESHLRMGLGDLLYFNPLRPAADGSIDWTGYMALVYGSMYYDMEGSVTGLLDPAYSNLDIAFWEPIPDDDGSGAEPGCVFVQEYAGKKFIPSTSQLGNHYRAAMHVHDSCAEADEDPDWTIYRTLKLIPQAGGKYELVDPTGSYVIDIASDGSFGFTLGSPQTYTITYGGTVVPPSLALSIVFEVHSGEDAGCTLTVDTDAAVRYVFDD